MFVRMAVRLTPGAGRNDIGGVVEGALRVRVAAQPVDGAANQALIGLIAEALDVARGRVTIVSGGTSRTKVIEIEGVPPEVLRSRWPGIGV